MNADGNAGRLDALREALLDLDTNHELDRHALDRILTACIGTFHREIDAARERRLRPKLFGGSE